MRIYSHSLPSHLRAAAEAEKITLPVTLRPNWVQYEGESVESWLTRIQRYIAEAKANVARNKKLAEKKRLAVIERKKARKLLRRQRAQAELEAKHAAEVARQAEIAASPELQAIEAARLLERQRRRAENLAIEQERVRQRQLAQEAEQQRIAEEKRVALGQLTSWLSEAGASADALPLAAYRQLIGDSQPSKWYLTAYGGKPTSTALKALLGLTKAAYSAHRADIQILKAEAAQAAAAAKAARIALEL